MINDYSEGGIKNEIRSDTCFVKGIVPKDPFLVPSLWQNSLIRINNAPVLCKDWLYEGVRNTSKIFIG